MKNSENTTNKILPEHGPIDENGREVLLSLKNVDITFGKGDTAVRAVKNASLAAAVSKEGVDYDALDGMPSHLFFMIAAPDGANDTHLEVLSRLSTILMDESFRNDLMNSPSVEEFLDLIDEKEKKLSELESELEKRKNGLKDTNSDINNPNYDFDSSIIDMLTETSYLDKNIFELNKKIEEKFIIKYFYK